MIRQCSIALCAALVASVAGCTGGTTVPGVDLGSHDLLHVDMTDLTAIDPLMGNPSAQKVATGVSFQFAQSPLWLASANRLLVTDTPASVVYQLALPTTLTSYRAGSNRTNGLALDQQGNVVFCELGTKQITRRDSMGMISVVASMYQGNALNGPFDAIVRSDGTIYFTDPGTGTLGYEGLYSIAPGSNTVTMLDMTMKFPDGIALSPDERYLYVSASNDGKVYRFPVETNGTLGTRSDFAQGLVSNDGLGVDDAGNVYVATMSGIRVFKADGTARGTVSVPSSPSNLSFGGTDRKTLFITAGADLYQVQLAVPGRP